MPRRRASDQHGSDRNGATGHPLRREDDRWLEITFPVWAPTRFAALAAGATVLAEACGRAEADTGVLRMAAGESAEELHDYRGRVHEMEAKA